MSVSRLLMLMLLLGEIAYGQNVSEVSLYPDKVPNSIPSTLTEKTILVNGTRRIYYVNTPTLTIYKPATPNNKAIIICPGGGYSRLSIDNEGMHIARALNDMGITAFVLKYRLPNDTMMNYKKIGPLQDVQQAIRLVRKNAVEWGVENCKLGIMGFSAGGHLAASAATHFNFIADSTVKDSISIRPDFAVLLYPVISFNDSITHQGSKKNLIGENPTSENVQFFSNEMQVTPNTPPVFIVHAGDDKVVPVKNSLLFYESCLKNGVAAELHVYPKGGHGFGLNNPTTADRWMDRMSNWLNSFIK